MVRPEDISALTEAPILSEEIDFDNQGRANNVRNGVYEKAPTHHRFPHILRALHADTLLTALIWRRYFSMKRQNE
jgi:predicted secreted protein